MHEFLIALVIFICLASASLGSLWFYDKLPVHHRQEDTHNVIKVIAGIFGVMTSLVLGLTVNSARNTYESVDRNVHTMATNLILLDRTLRLYGPETDDTRQRLVIYAKRAADGKWASDDPAAPSDKTSENLLYDLGASLKAIDPPDTKRANVLKEAQDRLLKVIELRWTLVEQSEGAIPLPIVAMLGTWLILIFASFGYRAPKNIVVAGTFVLAAGLIAGAIYLILDMDVPFGGPIQISNEPLKRAVVEMQR